MAYSGSVIPDGVYRIVSTMDYDINFDVAGGSGAQGANLQLWGNTDHITNTQLFWVEQVADDGIYSIRSYFTGFSITCEGNQPTSNVAMYKLNTGSSQQWQLYQRNTVTVNGASMPAIQIQSVLAPTLSLDACGAQSTPGTNVWLYTTAGTSTGWGQLWVFMPEDPYEKRLDTPTDLKAKLDDTIAVKLGGTGAIQVYPSWIGSDNDYQCRFRYRQRYVSNSDSWRSGWTNWYSYNNKNSSDTNLKYQDNGWGQWESNCDTSKVSGRIQADVPINFTLSNASGGRDLYEIEYECRRFEDDWKLPFKDWSGSSNPTITAHGGSASKVIKVGYKPTITVGAWNAGQNAYTCAWAPDGLHIVFSSSLNRGGNSISVNVFRVSDGKRMCFSHNESNQGAVATIIVPTEDLLILPGTTEMLRVDYTYVTCDGVKVTGKQQVKCMYGSSVNLTATISTSVVNTDLGYIRVDVTSLTNIQTSQSIPIADAEHKCWIITDDQTIEVEEYSTGRFYVYYPFNKPFMIYGYSCVNAETLWDTWYYESTGMANPYGSGYVFTLDNDTTCAIKYGLNEPMKFSSSTDVDYTSALTTARDYEVVHVSNAKAETITVTGVLAYLLGDTEAPFEKLKSARYAKMRDSSGHIYDVAIVGASLDRQYSKYSEVSVSLRRLS